MSDDVPLPPVQLPLPDDPIHPTALRLPVSELEVVPLRDDAALRMDLTCPRKFDMQNLEDVYVTRRFLLSRQAAEILRDRIQEALDQD